MTESIIISAANDGFLKWLDGMLSSLGKQLEKHDLGIIDLGLTEAGKDRIKAYKSDTKFVTAEWRRTFPGIEKTPDYKKYVTSKPFIPEMFPGYRSYVYVDGDIWFPDPTAIDDYIDAGRATGAAFSFEIHPGYRPIHKLRTTKIFSRNIILGMVDHYVGTSRSMFGSNATAEYGVQPVLNGGMFFISNDSLIWESYKIAVMSANFRFRSGKAKIGDQSCLQFALLKNSLPYTTMSSIYNWLPVRAAPLVDADTFRLLDPAYPHVPIKVMHLAQADPKKAGFELVLTDGRRIQTTGEWSDFCRLRANHVRTVGGGDSAPDANRDDGAAPAP